ncbi:hypothetical protein [Thiocystis violacea]|uniref:hypothetical protein n=1 Tax=Thiocystis violacea TaxID=13725 RepID=UPI0019065E30|nr:hypothetical protein [Thiocystis violacea]
MSKSISTLLLFFSLVQSTQAGLLGTELSLQVIYQATQSSSIETIGFLTTAVVDATNIEFPSVAELDVEGDNFYVVDVSINVGDNYIEIGFENCPSAGYTAGYQNGYVFTFDSGIIATITGAAIDHDATTIDLAENDVTFSGNQLTVNVEGLQYNNSSFVRIDLSTEGGPVTKPEISVNDGFVRLDTTRGNAPDDTDCENADHNGRMVFDELTFRS